MKNPSLKWLWLYGWIFLIFSGIPSAWGQELTPVTLPPQAVQAIQTREPLMTDRPDFTETPFAVPKGSLQMENGALWQKDDETRQLQIPETLLRLGISDRDELRFVVPSYGRWRGEEPAEGVGDIEAGFKHELGTLPGKIDLALMPMVTIPTGSGAMSANGVEGSVTLLWGREISKKTEIGGNLEVELINQEQGVAVGFVPTVVLSHSFSEKWAGLIEYRGEFGEAGLSSNFLHYAVMYNITPLHQLDARFGHALSGDAPSLLFGVGYSFRVDGLF